MINMRKKEINVIQVNLGNRCNQSCFHCHISASPKGKRNMTHYTAKKILEKLVKLNIKDIEFTGGAPELNPNLKFFIEELSRANKNLTVRTNLTVLEIPEYSFYMHLYKKHKVRLIASLPSVFEDTTDRQRGKGVFRKSLTVLKKLNILGYGTNSLFLDLVYNPSGNFLHPSTSQLQKDYKQILKEKYNIFFNNLITMNNSPIKKFRSFLKKNKKLTDYIKMLKEKYNPETLDNVMCRKMVSIDYNGNVYDCDFNLAENRRIKDYEDKKFWEINFSQFFPEIKWYEHCYACTANTGSSCHGALIKSENNGFDIKPTVKKYYGKELQKTQDLKTNACCSLDTLPEYIKDILGLINDEIKMKYYGCGMVIPLCVDGLKVLDVGCGTGRDVYILSKLVGEKGFCYGVDMTKNQIELATKYINDHTIRFGYKKPNVRFILEFMENLQKHFENESLDLVISNCVINLAENKEIVLQQIFNILKYGGEFYFADVYADRRVPENIRKNPVLYSECLGGALYYRDFERISKRVGFTDCRIVSKKEINITNPEIKSLIGNIKFYSITYRLWKLKNLEDACEDYGHIVIYKGGIPESPFSFQLDSSHIFYKDKPERVCGNTVLMLSETRFNKYFEIIGSFDQHFGEFTNCSSSNTESVNTKTSSCC